ncbi:MULTISPECIES: hypothetical protein [unclassified Neorhizobium]|uniref:hypothetical protein n=1 Tax=unclassified Neorhizobium TaxID=2629175 RepID=UPI001FF16E34|nr:MULTISPECIES: hypothetical protein [unclassified Neorhizobium]MCJ9669451.1 hypothetical protein [Neorhizobium sp. SHOUNA12B]MCJ9745524.1 hypothetical protein [Neorhizobium sp. SHOUNA12A]
MLIPLEEVSNSVVKIGDDPALQYARLGNPFQMPNFIGLLDQIRLSIQIQYERYVFKGGRIRGHYEVA